MSTNSTGSWSGTKNPIVTFIYTVFLALLISLFFGLGVSAFYPAPKSPSYPIALEKTTQENQTQEEKDTLVKYENEQKEYQANFAKYSRNVSMITLGLAVLALSIGLIFMNRISLISDGLMLGGVFTLIYSMIRGFMTEDVRYRFIIVSVGLLITLVLGYIKFIKPVSEK